jgi:hypothetical protein
LHGSNPEQPMSALRQKRTLQRLLVMSALPPKADIGTQSWNVRSVPEADSCTAAKYVGYSITSSAMVDERPSSHSITSFKLGRTKPGYSDNYVWFFIDQLSRQCPEPPNTPHLGRRRCLDLLKVLATLVAI